MTYIPDPVQRQVIDAHDPVLLVLGGAGTGKTITAAATARVRLERIEQQRTASTATAASRAPQPVPRALFLSFSRSSIAQIPRPNRRRTSAIPASTSQLAGLPRLRLVGSTLGRHDRAEETAIAQRN